VGGVEGWVWVGGWVSVCMCVCVCVCVCVCERLLGGGGGGEPSWCALRHQSFWHVSASLPTSG